MHLVILKVNMLVPADKAADNVMFVCTNSILMFSLKN